MKDEDILLREYIRDVIAEDVEVTGYLTSDELFGIGKALMNPISTFIGKAKELAVKTRTLLTVGVKSLVSTFVPMYSAKYKEIFDREAEDIKRIRSEYADVYRQTDEALRSKDALLLAFMVSPLAYLGTKAATMPPDSLKGLLSATTGGFSDDVFDFAKNKLEKKLLGPKSEPGRQEKTSSARALEWSRPRNVELEVIKVKDRALREDRDSGFDPMTILANKKFLEKVLSSPKTKEMQADALKVHRETIASLYGQVEEILKRTNTVDDIKKSMKLPPDKKVAAEKLLLDLKKLPPDEKVAAEKLLLDSIKQSIKRFYEESIKAHVRDLIEAGMSEKSQVAKDYVELIKKIQALS